MAYDKRMEYGITMEKSQTDRVGCGRIATLSSIPTVDTIYYALTFP